MARLVVEDLPDELYQRLAERAREEGRSLDDEVVRILQDGLARRGQDRSVAEILADMRRRRERNPPPPGAPDSLEMLREDRAR